MSTGGHAGEHVDLPGARRTVGRLAGRLAGKLAACCRLLRDLTRLIAPTDIICHVGNMVYRRALRYTLFTAGVGLLGAVAKQFSLPGLTVRQALTLPLIVGGLTLLCGFTMKITAAVISGRLMAVAQANALNLMEDYRKSQSEEHLLALWQRVFRHEAQLRLEAGQPVFPGCRPPAGLPRDRALECARREFLDRCRRALASHLPQVRQMHLVGIDLRQFEDWQDGAYLDRSDTKLAEQFESNGTLLAARRQARLCGAKATRLLKAGQVCEKLWFLLVTRCLAVRIGAAVETLNRRFGTDLFSCQVLLWPGEAAAAWLADIPGAAEAVLQCRRRVIHRIFGPDWPTAEVVLDRVLHPAFARATELRMRFDPEYCTEAMGYDVLADLSCEGLDARQRRRARRLAARAATALEAFDSFLAAARPELLKPQHAEALRAVRGAFHADRGRLKRRLMRGRKLNASPDVLAERLGPAIDAAAADAAAHTRKLIAVRMHHELTRLTRSGYKELLRDLAYATPASG